MDRIKFYSFDDLSVKMYVNKINNYLSKLDITKNYTKNVNKILEFFNIVKYKLLKKIDLDDKYQCKIAFLYKQLNFFSKCINDKNLLKLLKKVDNTYKDDFWNYINNYLDNVIITDEALTRILIYNKYCIRYILNNQKIESKFTKAIKKYLLKQSFTAEILIDEYEVIHNFDYKHCFFPEFSELELEKIFTNYINSEHSNLNYLQVIPDITSEKLILSDEIRLLALKKSKQHSEKFFSDNSGIKFGSEIVFGDFKQTIREEFKENTTHYEYDTKWIKDNQDYPTLMNNFIYLFNFVDIQMRFQNVTKKSELGLTDTIFGVHTKKEYPIGITGYLKKMTSLMQMSAYSTELSKYGLSIEKCISWFYGTYILNEFNIKDFYVYMPEKNLTYFEKCRLIFPEIDGIIKQYSIYQKHNIVDHELLEITSKPVLFENLKSLIKNKYVYPRTANLVMLNRLLFSDQSSLSYIKGFEKINTFFDLIIKSEVKINQFEDYQQDDLEWLFRNKIIKKNRQGYIKFVNPKKVIILYDLYVNEVISFQHYTKEYRIQINKLIKDNLCYFNSNVFTKPEIEYLNYYLNNRTVSNGLSLRNRYGHGTQPSKDKEKVHEQNYYYLLYIIVIITIKINDELCLHDDINNKSTQN